MDADPQPIGFARLRLQDITFQHKYRVTGWDAPQKDVDNLVKLFRKHGCKRADVQHFLDVEAPGEDCPSVLDPRQELPFIRGQVVKGLHGLRRCEAGKKYLSLTDQWWPVRLFSRSLPDRVKRNLSESFSHENPFSDGQIARMIRIYHREGPRMVEEKWWSRLSESKADTWKQFMKIDNLASNLDELLVFPGLWTFKIRSLDRVLANKCHEETIRYIRHIYAVWAKLLGDLPSECVDYNTVQAVQGLCPQSLFDRATLHKVFSRGEIFGHVRDKLQREYLWQRLEAIQTTIPSWETLIEISKMFEPCRPILQRLVCDDELDDRTSLQRKFQSCFNGQTPPVQVNDSQLQLACELESPEDRFILAYAQVVAACHREFPFMTDIKPKLEPCNRKRQSSTFAFTMFPGLWYRIAKLAESVGFDSEAIRDLASRHSKDHNKLPHISNDLRQSADQPLDLKRRLGRPYELDFLANRGNIFLPHIFSTAQPVNAAFVWRELFQECFGLQSINIQADSLPQDLFVEQSRTVLGSDSDLAAMLRSQLEDKTSQLSTLQKRMASLEVDQQATSRTHEEIQRRNQDLLFQNQELQHQVEKLEREISRSREEVHHVEERDALLQRAQLQSQQLRNETEDLGKIQDEKLQLERQVRELQEGSERRAGKISELEKQVRTLMLSVPKATESSTKSPQDGVCDTLQTLVNSGRGDISYTYTPEPGLQANDDDYGAFMVVYRMHDSVERLRLFKALIGEARNRINHRWYELTEQGTRGRQMALAESDSEAILSWMRDKASSGGWSLRLPQGFQYRIILEQAPKRHGGAIAGPPGKMRSVVSKTTTKEQARKTSSDSEGPRSDRWQLK